MEPSDTEIGNQIQPSRRKRRKTVARHLFYDYTQNTTLHGLKFTTEKGIHFIEKIFWMITIILSLGMCLYQIHNVWHKWNTSPVIVSFSEKILPVESVPFPSLTICPQIKSTTFVYNYTEKRSVFVNTSEDSRFHDVKIISYNISDSTAEDIKMFQDISLICPLPFYKREIKFTNFPNVTDNSTINNIIRVSPSRRSTLWKCNWLGGFNYSYYSNDCEDLFKPVLTKEGVCFNFNGLAANEIFRLENMHKDFAYNSNTKGSSGWDFNTGYNNSYSQFDTEQYPYRGQYSSVVPYLQILLWNHRDKYDENCNVLNKGYKVYTQHPADHPKSSVYSYAILPGQVSALALKVNMMNTSEKLQKYDAKVRQCYFASEKYLKYFKLYTESNCVLECVSIYTHEMCGCVPFHLPHTDGRSICTMEKLQCQRSKEFKKGLWERIEKCSCLPSCNSITYNAEILKTEFNMEKNILNHIRNNFNDPRLEKKAAKWELSELVVYYRDSGFVTITRSELYGVTDFLANIGGLLGLFLGFSFLSIVEIIYFFIIRLGFTFRRDIKNERRETNMKLNLESTKLEENANVKKMKIKHI